ncbi:MAG TPA: bifunctional aspartate kinase/homoserine dehydrogenase I [Thermoanaerobaculia bacterium]|jgi:aspartokinase/homoserine dehydrogenase 1|nr:bifunctional aspartate kinase/homoserine dehydrogenase I [Thermoanaerobaculia bacterium]
MKQARPEVFKFGGVAVGNADAIRVALAHVSRAAPGVAVVVSAMNGVTDLLLEAGQAALRRDRARCDDAAAQVESRHRTLVAELVATPDRANALNAVITESVRELRSMTESIAVLGELTPRAQDALVARGERLVAAIFAIAAIEIGIDAVFVDATEVIQTERRLGTLWPNLLKCERAAKKNVLPLLAAGKVVVMPGFLASGPDGSVVTLGRGGSDFSAAILARSIGARALRLFKEVDGLMTADPKSVPAARVIADLHYREAAELAYYGANVLHPRTMIPLVDRRIPLYVRNSFRETSPGTRIAGDVKPGSYPVKALTAIHRQALLSIEGNGMIGVPGVAGRAFTALSQAGHSVSMISQASSESSICFVVPESEADHAVAALEAAFEPERKLHLIDRIDAEKRVALIAVVGLGMRGTSGIAARTFSAIAAAGVNIVAIAQGSSELNITIAVSESDATRALLALHSEYQLHKIRPLADTTGREAKLTLLGLGQIGRELARQLIAQQPHLRRDLGIDLKVVAVADRSGIRIDDKGFTPAALQRFAKRKESGARLFERGSPLTLRELETMMRDELWMLPSYRPVLVDLTSEETGPLLQEALEYGFHVVCANKKPLAGPQLEFDRLMETAKERGLSVRYEATAGAGLPVLDTIAKLQEAGDKIEMILGCFSGTLGYLMTALEDGVAFSEAVRKAWELGYTEPDPRDDLSGMDVARKALILARTLGYRAEPDEIKLEPLVRSDGSNIDAKTFIAGLVSLDDEYRERVDRARRGGKVLRYVATIRKRSISVGVEAVPNTSPLAHLRGTANQVAIYSKRYKTNPLVVSGPGAGATVTAAGVLNDIVAIAMEERRRRSR